MAALEAQGRAQRFSAMTRLDRYVESTTLKALALVCASLTVLFSLLALLDQLHEVGEGEYRLSDALEYVLLTAPGRLLQLAPVAALLTTLLALGALANHVERGVIAPFPGTWLAPGALAIVVLAAFFGPWLHSKHRAARSASRP
ncbi:MAG: LptF/LptG family permease [Steroidobacteraceae bacterium]